MLMSEVVKILGWTIMTMFLIFHICFITEQQQQQQWRPFIVELETYRSVYFPYIGK